MSIKQGNEKSYIFLTTHLWKNCQLLFWLSKVLQMMSLIALNHGIHQLVSQRNWKTEHWLRPTWWTAGRGARSAAEWILLCPGLWTNSERRLQLSKVPKGWPSWFLRWAKLLALRLWWFLNWNACGCHLREVFGFAKVYGLLWRPVRVNWGSRSLLERNYLLWPKQS